MTTISVAPADQSHRQDVAQPAEGVVPDVRVVSNRECIRQVSQPPGSTMNRVSIGNPVDLRVFAENVRELRCSRTTRMRLSMRYGLSRNFGDASLGSPSRPGLTPWRLPVFERARNHPPRIVDQRVVDPGPTEK
jgi:hypothetical protein